MDNHIHLAFNDSRFERANRVTVISIIMNIVLAIAKLLAGIIAGSTAMVADGVHTLSDIVSSIAVIAGLFISNKPMDKDHPYGHERAESIAAIMLSVLLLGTGISIATSSVRTLISGDIARPGILAVWAAVLSIIIKEVQYQMTYKVGKDIKSSALMADAWHHRSDALSSIGTLLGIGGAILGYTFLDPLAGLIVSLLVIKVGLQIFKKGYDELMDTAVNEDKIREMVEIIDGVDGVISVNDIRTRIHGSQAFADIKICVNRNITVYQGHEIAHDVEGALMEKMEDLKDIMVHVNPCLNMDEAGKKNRECSGCQRRFKERVFNDIMEYRNPKKGR